MQFAITLLALLVINLNLEVNAIVISCIYRTDINGYGCDAQSFAVASSDDREVTAIFGDHRNGKSDDSVNWFHSVRFVTYAFPKNLKKFYKNLNFVYISKADVPVLTRSDMQSCGDKLKKFFMISGKLKSIEAGAFELNPNLEQIWLQGNQITHVGKGAFDKLEKLAVLRFNNNPCHSGAAQKRNGLVNLIEQIESNCKDASQDTSSSQSEPSTFSQQDDEVEKLKVELKKLTEEITRLRSENQDLKAQIEGSKTNKR